MREEEWDFWTARAHVVRLGAQTLIELRGVVTAQVYEALHLRIGIGPTLGTHTLILGWPALLAVTNISAVDAAARGTPASLRGFESGMTICVPEARLKWATEHSLLMSESGLFRRAFSLRPVASMVERVAG